MSYHNSRDQAAKLKRLHQARAIVGVSVIFATFTVVGAGVLALRVDADASIAMKWPGIAAVLLSWLFARIAKAIAIMRLSSA